MTMRAGTSWTPDEDAALRVLVANGMTDGVIGRGMGRTPDAVKMRRLRLRVLRGCQADVSRLALANSADHRPERQTVPSPHLEPHYRPWLCPPVTKTTEVIGALSCWSGWLPMRARMEVLEQRDAARDARDLALYVFDADGRWVGRRGEGVAA